MARRRPVSVCHVSVYVKFTISDIASSLSLGESRGPDLHERFVDAGARTGCVPNLLEKGKWRNLLAFKGKIGTYFDESEQPWVWGLVKLATLRSRAARRRVRFRALSRAGFSPSRSRVRCTAIRA
jgi:hypothetical protein